MHYVPKSFKVPSQEKKISSFYSGYQNHMTRWKPLRVMTSSWDRESDIWASTNAIIRSQMIVLPRVEAQRPPHPTEPLGKIRPRGLGVVPQPTSYLLHVLMLLVPDDLGVLHSRFCSFPGWLICLLSLAAEMAIHTDSRYSPWAPSIEGLWQE